VTGTMLYLNATPDAI